MQTNYPDDPDVVPVHVKFEGAIKDEFLQLMPEWEEFVEGDRALYCKAKKALYGIAASGLLFYNHLRCVLTKIISWKDRSCLVPLRSDPCVYVLCSPEEIALRNKGVTAPRPEPDDWQSDYSALNSAMEGRKNDAVALKAAIEEVRRKTGRLPQVVCTYVDDIFAVGTLAFRDIIKEGLLRAFSNNVRCHRLTPQTELEYISLEISHSEEGRGIYVGQGKLIAKYAEKFGVKGAESYPCTSELFEIDETSPELSAVQVKHFQSGVMSALFISRLTRPDALLSNCYLTTRLLRPTKQDAEKLDHLLKYIVSTKVLRLRKCPTSLQI
jgi:hypothetical protein